MEQEICACNGLANIEEWERSGYRMDYDRDGIPNFYDLDDDDDKLPTSVELGAGLNPFNPRDAHGDKDSDGLDNLWEYERWAADTGYKQRFNKEYIFARYKAIFGESTNDRTLLPIFSSAILRCSLLNSSLIPKPK